MINFDTNTYAPSACAVFRKSVDFYGALGNMSGGFPIVYKDKVWGSSEALYQAARYPHLPDLQEQIRTANNGFAAKLVAKANYELSRPDWMDVRVTVMGIVIRLKFIAHTKVRNVIKTTMEMPIVEYSARDPFWGAQPSADLPLLVGQNVLGKLWEELRDNFENPLLPDGYLHQVEKFFG